MIGAQLTLGKTPSLEFNVVKLVIWMVASTISFIFHPKFKVLELSVCKEKVERKLLMDSSTVSWYAIIYGGMCSNEYKESTFMSVKCGHFKKSKRAWLDTLIKDMDTWPDNSVKLCKCILRLICEMYLISQQGCIAQRLVYYCIQVNRNYVSLNGSSNCKILLLCINLQIARL